MECMKDGRLLPKRTLDAERLDRRRGVREGIRKLLGEVGSNFAILERGGIASCAKFELDPRLDIAGLVIGSIVSRRIVASRISAGAWIIEQDRLAIPVLRIERYAPFLTAKLSLDRRSERRHRDRGNIGLRCSFQRLGPALAFVGADAGLHG